MCGIAGLYRAGGLKDADRPILQRMNDALTHRGPDAEGFWFDAAAGVGLAQRRLAIIDLSPNGAQPMLSPSGRYAITFNGEIYDYKGLRSGLENAGLAPVWRGTSDTEVFLAAIEAYGLDGALAKIRGMFAFALFDRETRQLILGRDPIGEKPLYWGRAGGMLVFGSELKALTAVPGWTGTIAPEVLTATLRLGYVPAPMTLYREAHKVLPGQYAVFDCTADVAQTPRVQTYWDSVGIAHAVRQARFQGDAAQAEAELDQLLHASVARQSIADVPVGAFLSGGIDSSTIAAIMQAQRATPIETFTLGFQEEAFNEAPYAREVAAHLRTSHNEIVLSGQDACDLVERMPQVYDEPFADPSQLPTFLVAGFARRKVTVALSGDAGDELFAGYGRYHSLRRKWERGAVGSLTRGVSAAYARVLLALGVGPAAAMGMTSIAGQGLVALRLRLEDMAAKFSALSPLDAYERGFTTVDQAHRLVSGASPWRDPFLDRLAGEAGSPVLEQATLFDVLRYLPDDILVKVDRAAMAHGLETRIPLLDPDIIRFAWSLPDGLRVLDGKPKGLLKAVLSRYVPQALWDRKKRGFGIPAKAWLSGPFRTLASDLFSPARMKRQGYLEADAVASIWADFLNGGQRRTNLIWTLFVLQLYLAREMV
ncbi:MAG TPA: asparagine synthase (glutamine-hydrolyzing) [Alphaproteobacteria bacterium]|nr:asparagine synthase (glutamine-hydrolyzing) [Alphaproteobacteria bacterium]